jgi:hypothetical protein
VCSSEDARGYEDDVQSTEPFDDVGDGCCLGFRVGDVRGEAQPCGAVEGGCNSGVDVDAAHGTPTCQQFGRARTTDSGGGSGDHCDHSGQFRRRAGEAEFGLLKVPVLDVEDVAGVEGLVAVKIVFDTLEGRHRVLVDVKGDVCGGDGSASGQYPELGVDHDAWSRIKHRQFGSPPVFVFPEVVLVGSRVGGDIPAHQRNAFGANHVVGCEGPPRSQALQVLALDEAGGDLVAVTTQEHRLASGLRDVSPESGQGDCVQVRKTCSNGGREGGVLSQPAFGFRDQLMVSDIGLVCVSPKVKRPWLSSTIPIVPALIWSGHEVATAWA